MSNDEISNIESEISKLENLTAPLKGYLKDNPEDLAVQLELKSFQKRIDELTLELSFLNEDNWEGHINEDVNLHFSGKFVKNNSIFAPTLIKLIETYEDMITIISAAIEYGAKNIEKHLDADFKNENSHYIKTLPGSFMITFSPVVHEDYQSTLEPSLNKLSFEKLCELIKYEEDVEKIIEQADSIGTSAILKYKKFIEILDKNELNMDIHEGDVEEPIITLAYEKAHNIYHSLNSFKEENVKIEQIEKEGILYYINTDNKKCGIKFFDEELGKQRKIHSINFQEGLKLKVKEKVDSEVKVILDKTTKTNLGVDSSKPIFDLVEIL